MDPIDRQILAFCLDGFRPLKSLTRSIPSGTLYRHVKRLVRLGWLQKEGNLYQTTEPGHRQLADAAGDLSWEALAEIYPPLALVPTPVHRAQIELILAAVVARQHETRPDRHPFFGAFGSTLRWKTSSGRFICYALGLDPALHIVDCGSEAGRSLTFRRGSDGTLVSRRALLEAPFLVLDEFQTADRSVRSTLGVFLSGRLVTPVENEQLTIRPVPLLTLNPKAGTTLEGRLGLSAPLIRRAILVDLDAVHLPDLAAVGERAVDAAKTHTPLVLGAPRGDLRGFHDTVVGLTRAVLLPDAHERVDVEIVLNLAGGMTAFIADPVAAIAQVVHGLGVLAETLGWARPGWIATVSDFRSGSKPPAAVVATMVRVTPAESQISDGARKAVAPADASISLAIPAPAPRRRTTVPELDLSDELRARLTWLAVETGQSVEEVLTVLIDHYVEWRHDGDAVASLARALALAKELEVADISLRALEAFLETRATLAEHGCSFEDVPEALRVLALLEALPETWRWDDAERAMGVVAELMAGEIPVDEVRAFLARHRRLVELGFDDATAEALAETLARAGASGERRDAVVNELVLIADERVDRDRLEAERGQLEADVKRLGPARERLTAEVTALRQQRDELQAEWSAKRSQLELLRAWKVIVLRTPASSAALSRCLRRLLEWLQAGQRADDAVGQRFTESLRREILDGLQTLAEEI